ncbi:MAG: hypothetical protein GF328_05840 [Candidatus Latescibacteria bacterium]|nr:hypothetical protein [Candidatus Latescibacterota bacterium]
MARTRRGWRSKLLLLSAGILVALLLAEIAARAFWADLAPPADVQTDYPLAEKPFPGRGFFLLPDSSYESRYDGDPYDQLPPEKVIRYTLNEEGFREGTFSDGGDEGEPLVAVLGDSFVFGEGVEQHRTLTVVAQSLLRASWGGGVRVLNLGVPGYATEDERDLAAAFLPRVEPDVVIVGYCLNDPLHWEDQRQQAKKGVDLVVQRDAYREKGGGDESPFYLVRLVRRAVETRRLTSETVAWYRGMYEGAEAPWIQARNFLLEIRNAARRAGARMGILLFPIFFRLESGYPFESIHTGIVDWCGEVGIPVRDTLPDFRGRETESLVVHPKDHHPNAAAHAVLGRALADLVVEVLEAERE